MARILTIGIATLDIINSVDGFPPEDSEVRALSQAIRRGGNAANTAVVLAQLGHDCAWAGTISDDAGGETICHDLRQHGISIQHAQRIVNGHTPTSYIIHNRHNGSRSIVHYRDLPEFSNAMFNAIDLSQYDWLHVEGRNCSETAIILRLARQHRPDLSISVEIEKVRPAIEDLFELADLLLFSRAYAQQLGFQDAETFLCAHRPKAHHADRICAWSEAGAWALARTQAHDCDYSPAYPPPQIIDTLAAGDTFNAGVIDACCRQQSLAQAIAFGCRLAGYKCGVNGLTLNHTAIEQMLLGQSR